jgi:hypothetical protein
MQFSQERNAMEKITGPINGFYVASYAIEIAGSGRFSAYAKVCSRPPESYWEARCIFKLFGGEDHPSAEAALAWANLAARAQIVRLPALDVTTLGFPMFDEAKQVVFPLAAAIRRRAAA